MANALVLKAIFNLVCHHIADLCIRPHSIRNTTDGDVTLGDYPDQLVALLDGEHSDIE